MTNLEKTIVGAALLDGSCAPQMVNLVREEFFTDHDCRIVFRAIKALVKASSPVDILTVSIETKKIDKDFTAANVSALTNGVSFAQTSEGNMEHNCRILTQQYISRELVLLGHRVQENAAEAKSDPFEVIKFIEDTISRLTDFAKSGIVTLDDALNTLFAQIYEVRKSGKPLGVTSGLSNLDVFNGGWIAPDFNIVAARPGMGKTAFALTIANNAVKSGKPTAFFSLEMSATQLAGRIASSESEYTLNSNLIGRKILDEYQFSHLSNVIDGIKGSNFFIDDTPALKLMDFQHRSRKLVHESGVKLIIIDYLQLMVADAGSREQEISTISRTLKATAKELNVPIIALSQLSRKVEERANKRPQLSDLRESGAIEQDADNIYFLWRPEYYEGLFPDGMYQYGNQFLPIHQLMLVIAEKGRNHGLGEVPLRFNGEYMMVTNFDV